MKQLAVAIALALSFMLGEAFQAHQDLHIVQQAFNSTIPSIQENVWQAAALLDMNEGK